MPKRLLKRIFPDHRTIRRHHYIRVFGDLLHDPNLWHLNRRSVSSAFSIGLFVAYIPIPFQMVLAAAIAILCRANLVVSVSLVWITNPVTMAPIFYFAYKTGAWILDTQTRQVQFELSVNWLTTELGLIWQPFLLGCFLLGTVSAVAGNIFVRWFWRLHVSKNWQQRRKQRKLQKLAVKDIKK